MHPRHCVCGCVCICRRRLPDFTISYSPDFRDAIAKTWPASIDDSAARKQWHWQPKYGECNSGSCRVISPASLTSCGCIAAHLRMRG